MCIPANTFELNKVPLSPCEPLLTSCSMTPKHIFIRSFISLNVAKSIGLQPVGTIDGETPPAKLFGTSGIRGTVDGFLTAEFAAKVGQSFAAGVYGSFKPIFPAAPLFAASILQERHSHTTRAKVSKSQWASKSFHPYDTGKLSPIFSSPLCE